MVVKSELLCCGTFMYIIRDVREYSGKGYVRSVTIDYR